MCSQIVFMVRAEEQPNRLQFSFVNYRLSSGLRRNSGRHVRLRNSSNFVTLFFFWVFSPANPFPQIGLKHRLSGHGPFRADRTEFVYGRSPIIGEIVENKTPSVTWARRGRVKSFCSTKTC